MSTDCCGPLGFAETHVLVAFMNGDGDHARELLAEFTERELDDLDDNVFAVRVAIRRAQEAL